MASLTVTLAVGSCSRGRVSQNAPLQVDVAQKSASTPMTLSERERRCEVQAARVAADGLWRSDSTDGADDGALRWVAHYSEKYDQCYVVIDRRVPVHDGARPIVSELWEAFEATVLAGYTHDARATMRRSLCQVDLSDDPFTSCAVSKYFIDEHMTH